MSQLKIPSSRVSDVSIRNPDLEDLECLNSKFHSRESRMSHSKFQPQGSQMSPFEILTLRIFNVSIQNPRLDDFECFMSKFKPRQYHVKAHQRIKSQWQIHSLRDIKFP
jgi:hypothetical protein